MKPHAIGIDLGTTNTIVAAVSPAGHTEILPTREGELRLPSVVLFTDERTVAGREAQLRGRSHPDRLAACAKRAMGQTHYDHHIGGESLPPEVIQACVLEQAKQECLGKEDQKCRAVIAVPAHFTQAQRHATGLAAEIAGLNLVDLVNEPIAAAIAFAEDAPLFSIAESEGNSRTVLVFDLGGYTFEATLLSIRPGEMTMVASDHDSFLGGHDWDMRLADLLAEPFVREHQFDPRETSAQLDQLVQRAIQIKHTLSGQSHAATHLELGGRSETIRLTREQFENATSDLVERTGVLCDRLLQRAELDWSRVTQVLLVGGATRMPMIRRMLAGRLGREADDRVCPEEAVARGAAIYAARALNGSGQPPTLKVRSTSTHSLGIEGVDQETGERVNKIVIPKGTPLPAKVTRDFTTKGRAQRSIVFSILEGESPHPSECTKIGLVVLRDLPSELSEEWPIEVTYEYSQSGRLSVDARVRYTDRSVHLEVVRPAGVSKTHVAHWKEAVAALAGFASFRKVCAWEREVGAPAATVVSGLPQEDKPDSSGIQAFLHRVMPFVFRPRKSVTVAADRHALNKP